MTLKKTEKTGDNEYTLEISVEREPFDAAIEKAYRKTASRYNLPGFRRGKAPRRMIEKAYGEGVFYDEAINIAFPEAYADAIKEADLHPVDDPQPELTDVSAEGFTFTAKVTVYPEVTLGQYKGLAVSRPAVEVTDADVDEALESRRARAGHMQTAERPAANGDTVVIDFEGFIDGQPFEGGRGENHNLKLGSGQFIPGFEEQLIGCTADIDKDVEVSFPDDYHAAELAGKAAIFKTKIREVKENILPELDDELAKDISEFETLAELKADIREKMIQSREKSAEDEYEGRLIDAMIATMEANIPEVMIERQVDRIADDYRYRMQSQGMTLEGYLQMTGMDLDSFRKTFAPQAERQVKTQLALAEVIKQESFDVADDEVEAEYGRLAEEYKMPEADIRKYMPAAAVKDDMITKKAIDLIKSTAVAGEDQPAAKPAPKKRAPAKKKAEQTAETAESADNSENV